MAIDLDNLEIVMNKLGKLARTDKVESAITKATLYVEGEARKNAGKISNGELANSIASRVNNLKGEVYTPLEYAPYVEYGTGLFAEGKGGGRKEVPWVYVEGQPSSGRAKTIHTEESAKQAVAFLREKGLEAYKTYGQHPQPYMRPALDENKEAILALLGEGLVND